MTTGSPSLPRLRTAYDDARAYVDSIDPAAMAGYVSGFWAEILAGRANYPSFDEMLSMRRGATYPMAERRDLEDEEAELEYAQAAHDVASKSVPAAFLDELDEPSFGSPVQFDFGGRRLSANCLVNAVTVHGVLETLRRAGTAERPLRILEIGAGFGQVARALIERLDVRTYAVCDLPENLFLSAFYLQALFPGRTASFGGGDAGLAFVVPPHAAQLSKPFDLVLNSYSFQEMNRASVEEYFSLAARTLSRDGRFYSLNSHGKDEIAWPSEYPTGAFRIERLASPRKFPFQLNATIPYELDLSLRQEEARNDPGLVKDGLDGIGCAFQLGLDEELEGFCERFTRGSLASNEVAWVEHLAGLFRAPEVDQKRFHVGELCASGVLPAASAYLAGCLAYGTAELDEASRRLSDALPGLGGSLARIHATAMLGTLAADGSARNEARRLAEELAPHLAVQVADLASSRDAYAPHIRACLRLEAHAPTPSGRIRNSIRRIRRSIPMASR